MKEFIASYPLYQIIITGVVVLCAIIQLVYWMRYMKVATHSHKRNEPKGSTIPPVSVVVIVDDNPMFVSEHLPKLLTQNHPNYEVVVVDDGREVDVTDELAMMQTRYPHLRYTKIKADPIFKHSRKLALTVGIKAAKYENIIFTDADAIPTSDRWLSIMSRGFNGGKLVIGYTGIEQRKGWTNKVIRCQRLTTGIRYLNSAIGGKPFRGIYNNIGYTKKLFFDNKGYTHLRMTLGEDDLFVQKVMDNKPVRTSVILSPNATIRQFQQGGFRWWKAEKKYRSAAFAHYPKRVKFSVGFELLTRALLTLGCIALIALQVPILWIVAASAFGLRELTMILTVRAITRRVGERKLMWAYIPHDLLAPVGETLLWISRRVRPSQHIWIQ